MGNSSIIRRKPYGGGTDMRIKNSLALAMACMGLSATTFSHFPEYSLLKDTNKSNKKPNRVSQKKRRLNNRRKGK